MLRRLILVTICAALSPLTAKADVVYRTVPEAIMPTGPGEPPVDPDRFRQNRQLVLDVVKKASHQQVKDLKKMSFLYADVNHDVIEYHFSSENYVYDSVTCQLHLQFRVNTKERDRIPYAITARNFRCDDDF